MGGSGIVYGLLCVAENRRRVSLFRSNIILREVLIVLVFQDRKGTSTVERVLATGEKIDNNSADLTDGQNELCKLFRVLFRLLLTL